MKGKIIILMFALGLPMASNAAWYFHDFKKDRNVSLLMGKDDYGGAFSIMYYCGSNGKIDIAAVAPADPGFEDVESFTMHWMIGKNEIKHENADESGKQVSLCNLEYDGKPPSTRNPDIYMISLSDENVKKLFKLIPAAGGEVTLSTINNYTRVDFTSEISGNRFSESYNKFVKSCKR